MREWRPAIRPIRAVTLIELLVVIAIISILAAVLLPALQQGRKAAQIVRIHSDLRQIMFAIEGYATSNAEQVPPSRSACGASTYDQLPVELAIERFLPASPTLIPQAHFIDPFSPVGDTYKYRAPGALWFNGTLFDAPEQSWRPRSRIWVPSDFPTNRSQTGAYFGKLKDEPPCPVRVAIWSVGPDPESPKFPRHRSLGTLETTDFPLPARFWLTAPGDTGLITHFQERSGRHHMSP